MRDIMVLRKYYESNEKQRELLLQEHPPDYLNYGKDFHNKLRFMIQHLLPIHNNNIEEYISHEIELWANGASDHLYEIEVPDGKEWDSIRKKVKKLQNKGLNMDHTFREQIYTFDDLTELMKLTDDIALMIDRKIGLKPDIGEWP